MKENATATATGPQRVGLGRLLCGVDGSRTDPETVTQAATLAGSDGALDLVCVSYTSGFGLSEGSMIARSRAERALDHARRLAAELGVEASTELVSDRDRWNGIASRIAEHDLLVLGGHRRSRAEGVLGGSLSTVALHRAPLPVLLARPSERRFPGHVLLATDGGEDCRLAAQLAAAIARRHAAAVTLLTIASDEDRAMRHELAEQVADIFRASGVEPVVVVEKGSPRTGIVEAVARYQPTLVVLGSGRKLGVRAIGSVSEHVAHHVPCSALVARGRGHH